jgi:hypothetical protein
MSISYTYTNGPINYWMFDQPNTTLKHATHFEESHTKV